MTTRLTHNWQDSKNNVSLIWHLHPVKGMRVKYVIAVTESKSAAHKE